MTKEEQQEILQAILRDDPAAFDRLVGKRKNLCFGRFSLLDLCYLYGSRRIVSAYGGAMRQGEATQLDELPQIYNDFVRVAGRALRLWAGYTHHAVHPLEMLAVTGNWRTLRREFPTYVLGEAEQSRLLLALKLRYGVQATIEGNAIILPPKPLRPDVQRLLWAGMAVGVVVILAAIAALSVGLVYRGGIPVRTAAAIDGASGKQYVLQSDLQLEAGLDWSDVRIDGHGHTIELTVGDTPFFDVFGGKVANCTVLMHATAVEVGAHYACLAATNNGTWRNVRFVLEGEGGQQITLKGFVRQPDAPAECHLGALFITNKGTLEGCYASGDVSIAGQSEVDGQLGYFACLNEGTIAGCTLESSVDTDTVDVGGLVFRNQEGGVVRSCTLARGTHVKQVTSSHLWSPIIGGLVGMNYGTVEDCAVYGEVRCVKQNVVFPDGEEIDWTYIHAGGVAAVNYGTVRHTVVAATVSGEVPYERTIAYVGGIVGDNYYDKDKSTTRATLSQNIFAGGTVHAGAYAVYVGCFAGASSGYLDANCSSGTLSYANYTRYGYLGVALGYARFEQTDRAEMIQNNHVKQLSFGDVFATVVPLVGYHEQSSAGLSTVDGITAHVGGTVVTLEEYWYEEQ